MVNVKKIGTNLVKNTNSLIKKISPKPIYKVSHKYMYISFFIIVLLIVGIIWYFTRKESFESKVDGSNCIITDKNGKNPDISFNISASCKDFKDVMMASSLIEFSNLKEN